MIYFAIFQYQQLIKHMPHISLYKPWIFQKKEDESHEMKWHKIIDVPSDIILLHCAQYQLS
jgi:hypothetical protein